MVGMILRNAMLINGILTNSKAWYGIKKDEIEALEKIDENLLRTLLETPSSTPKEMLYLELGCLPIKFILRTRRLMFLQYILQQEENSLIHRFFKAQVENPVKNDWCLTVKEDLESISVNLNLCDVKRMSKQKFKEKVNQSIKIQALNFLTKEKK